MRNLAIIHRYFAQGNLGTFFAFVNVLIMLKFTCELLGSFGRLVLVNERAARRHFRLLVVRLQMIDGNVVNDASCAISV